MSKSLKNFVSIQDYLQAAITSSPADDFRLYCLQHKYHATLTYSPSRVEESAKFRTKVEGFNSSLRSALSTIQAVDGASTAGMNGLSNHSIGNNKAVAAVNLSRKPTEESARLSALLRLLQEEVHGALSDDVDTPRVLNCISQLVGEATLYLQLLLVGHSSGAVVQPIEPLLAVSNYVHRILTIFGLQFPAKQPAQQLLRSVKSCGTANSSAGLTGNGISNESIDAILKFRSSIRAAALVGMKAVRAQKKTLALSPLEVAVEENLQQILAQCDAGREQLGSALHVKVEDLTASSSKWTAL
jgi:cysteinyl-tRNA synthetase